MPDSPNLSQRTSTQPAFQDETLEQFLGAVERRAWRMAWLATRDREEALDLVQDTMMAFVRKYAQRATAERRPLFYRMLNNRLRDWGRRQTVRRRWLRPWLRRENNGAEADAMNWEPMDHGGGPEQHHADTTFIKAAQIALSKLPARQREAFLLRELEGLDVADTARAMGVSAGSVKTHYFRALQSLRTALEEHR